MSDPIEDYITAHRGKHSREELTSQLEAAGHDRVAIDAVWDRLPSLTAKGAPPTAWNATPNVLPSAVPGYTGSDILVRTYRGSQTKAAAMYQADANQLAALGYRPVSQSWAQGDWGCSRWIITALLLLLLILPGLLFLSYTFWVKPAGTLTVTYQRQAVSA